VKKVSAPKPLKAKRAKRAPRTKTPEELEVDYRLSPGIKQAMTVLGAAHQDLLRENEVLRFRLAHIEARLGLSFIETKPEPECTCGECVERASTLN
jgi:hypothetical protein